MPGWASRVGWLFILAYASGLVATRVHLARLGVPHLGADELLDVESVLVGSFAIALVLAAMNLFRAIVDVPLNRLHRVLDDLLLVAALLYVVSDPAPSLLRTLAIMVAVPVAARIARHVAGRQPSAEARDPVERLIDTILLRAETERQGALRVAIVSVVTVIAALLVQPSLPLSLGGGRPVPVVIEARPGGVETKGARIPASRTMFLVAQTDEFLVLQPELAPLRFHGPWVRATLVPKDAVRTLKVRHR